MKKIVMGILFCFLTIFLQASDCDDVVGSKRFRENDLRSSRKKAKGLMTSQEEVLFLIKSQDSSNAIEKISDLLLDGEISNEAVKSISKAVKGFKLRISSPQKLDKLDQFLDELKQLDNLKECPNEMFEVFNRYGWLGHYSW